MDEIKKHVHYVNYIKAIAIILVLIGHTNSPFSKYIYSFHMPLYFSISGFFIRKNSIRDSMKKDLKRLIVPYLIFAVVSVLLGDLKNIILKDPLYEFRDIIHGIVYAMDQEYMTTYGFVLWFLLALFWSKRIGISMISCCKSYIAIPSLLVLGCLSLLYQLPFAINQGVLGSFWIVMGYYSYNYLPLLMKNKIRTLAFYLVCFILYFVMIGFIGVPYVDMASLHISNYSYYIAYNIVFILIIITTAMYFKQYQINWLNKIGESTMFIFILHPYTNNIGAIISHYQWIVTCIISITCLGILHFSFKKLKYFMREKFYV